MNKKYLYFLLVPFILNGCANNKNNSQSNKQEIDDSNCLIKEETTITFLSMVDDSYLPKLQSMIASFEKTEPHVKVIISNPLGAGNYSMLENIVVASHFKGNLPDLVQCYPDNVIKYMGREFVLELNKYINNSEYGIDKNEFIDTFWNEGTQYNVEGTYSLPFCKSTELLYYNATALLGRTIPGINNDAPLTEEFFNDITWEALFDVICPAIKTYNDALPEEDKILKTSDSSAIFTYDSDENFFITLANQYGYGYTSIKDGKGSVDFDNPEMKALVKKLKAAKDAGYLQTKGSYHNYVSYLFQKQNALFTVSSTAGLSYNYNNKNPFLIKAARLPHAAGKEYSSINQGPSICILDHNDENRALASYLLWKHITNEEFSLDWALTTGYMCIRKNPYESKTYKDALVVEDQTDLFKVAKAENLIKTAEVRSSTFNTPIFKGSSNARTNVGILLKDCLLSENLEENIDQLFKEASDEAETHL